MERHVGKVAWFNSGKGYGFLTYEGGPDVFCHHTAIQAVGYRTLKEGEDVEFSIEQGSNGRPQAVNVIKK